MLTYQEQIEWIKRLQELFAPLKPLAIFLNYLDTTPLFVLMILIIWMSISRQLGFRTLVALVFSGLITSILKQFYDAPRPLALEPSVAWLNIHGFGFPSGGATSSLLLSLCWFDSLKNKKIGWVIFFYAILISLSRVVLGAHFFTDVLGGWAIAIILFLAYKKLYLPYEDRIFPIDKKGNFKRCFLMLLIFPFFLINYHLWNMAFFTLGVIVSNLYFPCKKLDQASQKVKFALGVLTLMIVLGLEQLLVFDQVSYLIYLMIGFVMFPICQKLLSR